MKGENIMDFIAAAKNVLSRNMGLKAGERFLVLCDETALRIGESLFAAGLHMDGVVARPRLLLDGRVAA